MFLEGLQIAESAEFIQEGVLVIIASILGGVLLGLTDQAGGRDILDVDLDPLTRVGHLLVGLGDVFWVRQLYRHLTSLSQKAIQTGYRTGVASLPELDPEDDDAGVWIPSPHILDELGLLRRMLVGMTVGAM